MLQSMQQGLGRHSLVVSLLVRRASGVKCCCSDQEGLQASQVGTLVLFPQLVKTLGASPAARSPGHMGSVSHTIMLFP